MQIQLKVDIDEKEGSAVLDFAGTGCEIRGNLNAPISVVHSAVIYCMRAMLDMDIPLNAGCLVPITGAYWSFLRWLYVPVLTKVQSSFLRDHSSLHPRRLQCAEGTS